jgi:hypothetical protein
MLKRFRSPQPGPCVASPSVLDAAPRRQLAFGFPLAARWRSLTRVAGKLPANSKDRLDARDRAVP